MRRRTLLIITAAVVIAIAVTTAVLWMNGKSYDDTVKACQKALAAQYKAGGKGKPDDCKGVKADDYDALVMQAAMDSLGWTDEDGNFDKNKMLDSVAEQP